MTEPTSQLHLFDLTLCRYAADHVAEHLNDLRVPNEDQLKYAGLIEYLRQRESPGCHIGPDMSELLLNSHEFNLLHCWAKSLEVANGRPVPTSLVPKWTPCFHRRAVECFQEIKQELTQGCAQTWLSDSEKYADQLEEDGLLIFDGVWIVQLWTFQARRYLRAMGKDEFVPRPDGDHPTPTTIGRPRTPESKVATYLARLKAAPTAKQYKKVMEEALENCQPEEVRELAAMDEKIISFVESMRWAINQGGDATGGELIRRVKEYNDQHPQKRASNRQRSFLALRILEHLGEHTPGESKAKRRV